MLSTYLKTLLLNNITRSKQLEVDLGKNLQDFSTYCSRRLRELKQKCSVQLVIIFHQQTQTEPAAEKLFFVDFYYKFILYLIKKDTRQNIAFDKGRFSFPSKIRMYLTRHLLLDLVWKYYFLTITFTSTFESINQFIGSKILFLLLVCLVLFGIKKGWGCLPQ